MRPTDRLQELVKARHKEVEPRVWEKTPAARRKEASGGGVPRWRPQANEAAHEAAFERRRTGGTAAGGLPRPLAD